MSQHVGLGRNIRGSSALASSLAPQCAKAMSAREDFAVLLATLNEGDEEGLLDDGCGTRPPSQGVPAKVFMLLLDGYKALESALLPRQKQRLRTITRNIGTTTEKQLHHDSVLKFSPRQGIKASPRQGMKTSPRQDISSRSSNKAGHIISISTCQHHDKA